MTRPSIVVHKFGGAALRDGAGVRHAVALIAARARDRAAAARVAEPTLVIASAPAGVTDALLALAELAVARPPATWRAELARLRAWQLELADATLGAAGSAEVHGAIAESFEGLDVLCAAAHVAGETSAGHRDRVLACGERLSARLLAAALAAAGVAACYVDAAALVHTDGRHGDASPDLAATTAAARRLLPPLLAHGVVPVVPGFIGRGPLHADDVVTLGRGGSDLTATLLARALGAGAVLLWKDVPGLLSADPRVVPDARVVARLDVGEAAALAQYGAKVLHPRALAALPGRTHVQLRPFANAEAAGTTIARGAAAAPVVAIAASAGQALLQLVGGGVRAQPGIVARTFAALHEAGIASALISQAATEYALGLTVGEGQAARAVAVLRGAFATELAGGELSAIWVRTGVATVGVVGRGAARDPAVASRIFAALAGAAIEVLATAHAASGTGVAVVVDAERAAEAQRVLHRAFQLHRAGGGRAAPPAHTDVVLLGVGAIGRALLSQLSAAGAARRPALRVCALVDSAGVLFAPQGLSRRQLAGAVARKRAGRPLTDEPGARAASAADALAEIASHALSHPILVDLTAADTSPLLVEAFARGFDVVLANKLPLAVGQAAADALHDGARRHGRQLLHEATVGAGLPVIDTLRKLHEGGDRVLRIEGCPSGTLGYLFAALGGGRPFSDALRDAMAAGYTEPDPRADLSGMDVARKALILARLLGFRGDLAQVKVESLVPPALRDVPLEEFLTCAPELDAAWAARVRAAGARGRVLRYRARVTRRSVTVGLVAVAAGDPLATLSGTDNQFAFTTTRYREQPLVITGPGAGPAVTAAGVLGDLLRLVAERGAPRPATLPPPHARRAPRARQLVP